MSLDLDPTIDFTAGTVAGIAGILVAQPFDTVKVRLQNPSLSSRYRSTFNAFTTIVREERFRGLYKGVVSPLATCAFMNGLVFASYKLFTKAQLDDPAALPSLAQIAAAGAGCGIVTSLIASPTELVKIRQQNVLGGKTSAIKVAMGIFKQSGIRGLYRGLSATALRDTGYGAYFMAYEGTCRYFRSVPNSTIQTDHTSLLSEIDSEARSTPWSILFLAAAMAGIAGWVATFPMDVIKTRMQSTDITIVDPGAQRQRFSDPHNPYRTILSTLAHSYRSEGYRMFFRGLVPTLIRSVPVNIATFSVYESVVHVLS